MSNTSKRRTTQRTKNTRLIGELRGVLRDNTAALDILDSNIRIASTYSDTLEKTILQRLDAIEEKLSTIVLLLSSNLPNEITDQLNKE